MIQHSFLLIIMQVAQHHATSKEMNAVLGELLLSDELELENAEAEDEKDLA